MLALPSKVVAEYWYNGSGRINDQHANVNCVFLSFAKGSNSTSGLLHLTTVGSTLKADIADLQSRGIPVILSIGGINDINGSSHGYTLKTATQISEAVSSLKSLISDLQVSGIDWDLEDPFNFTVSAMVDVTNQLCAVFPGLIVTMAAMYFDSQSTSGMYRQVATALGSNLTSYMVQFYDHSGWSVTSWQTDVANTVAKLVPVYGANRVMIGYMRPDDNGLNVPASTFKTLWESLAAKYPGLRGGFRWTSGDDKNNGWEFASQVGSSILSGAVPVPAPTPTPTPSPTPTPTMPTSPTKVTIGSVSHKINGTNIYRNTDYLVVFTPAKGSSTGTNAYGCEVTVVGGKVTKVADGVGNTAIPSNGYVLSGHGTSRTWLKTYAKVGAAPVLS